MEPAETGLAWETPPGRPSGKRFAAEAAALKAAPGAWLRLTSFPVSAKRPQPVYTFSWSIEQGKYAAFRPEGAFETVVRRIGDEMIVYVRYAGDGVPAEEPGETVLCWEDPPPESETDDPRYNWRAEAAAMKKKPGEWLKLKTYPAEARIAARVFASKINGGRPAAFRPAAAFEGVSREVDGGWAVYARYRVNA